MHTVGSRRSGEDDWGCRRSILSGPSGAGEPWTGSSANFDVAMGGLDGTAAEVSGLIGLLMLSEFRGSRIGPGRRWALWR